MGQNLFKSIGNLAYYHNWSPNYFYFSSLFGIANMTNTRTSYGSPSLASTRAQQAINDAQAHSNMNNMNEEDASAYMINRFENVITFLRAAYNMELANEQAFFKKKYNEFKSKFGADADAIAPLAELLDMFKDYKDDSFDYPHFIALINVIMMGLDKTKTIAEREEGRIDSINTQIEEMVKSRESQVSGLAYKKGKSAKETAEMIQKAGDKVRQDIKVEYLNSANLTSGRWSDGKFNYNLWGAKKYFGKIDKTVDQEVAKWVTDTVNIIVQDKKMLQALATYLQSAYPKATDFSALEADIKQMIITSVQEYGLKNLSKILASSITKKATKDIVKEIVNDPNIFDTVHNYRIDGLYNNYGQLGRASKLLEGVTSIDDLDDPIHKGDGLFQAISDIIAWSKQKSKQATLTSEQILLKQVFEVSGEWEQITELDNMIHRLQTLDAEIRKRQDAVDKEFTDIETALLEEKGLFLGKDAEGSSVYITFEIVDGKVQVKGDIKELVSRTQAFQDLGIKQLNTDKISSITGVLKRKATANLRKALIEGLNATMAGALERKFEDEGVLLRQIQQGLENMHISIGGPKLSEVASALEFRAVGNDLIVDWAGSINGKNDVITISVNTDKVSKNLDLNLDDIISDSVSLSLEQPLLQAREHFIREWHEGVKRAIGKFGTSSDRQRYKKIASSFLAMSRQRLERDEKINKAYDDLKRAWKEYKDTIKDKIQDETKLAELEKKFLDSLSDSFYISTTVKTYQTYVNDIGFHGGSLGGNLDDQLARIASIFALGGISIKDDLKWLRSAILNCSPISVVKEKNKNLIEDYLGSVAALALFDEGGAEAKIVSAILKQTQDSVAKIATTPDILHLYRTNTLYVPGSYVLQQVLLHLENDVITNIQSIPTVIKRGAGVTIINKASESMVENRPIQSTENPKKSVWTITGQKVADSIDIQILFLAGLLDIVKGINESLGNIELPG